MDIENLMKLALGISKRAETYDSDHLASSFVEIGHLPTLLKNNDSAIIFGRRGTGKTHLLSYLSTQLKQSEEIVISIDMRTIGSSAGLYGDTSLSLSERATRLLRDTANSIYEELLENYTDPSPAIYGSGMQQGFSNLVDAANSLAIDGAITREQGYQATTDVSHSSSFGGRASLTGGDLSASFSDGSKMGATDSVKILETGNNKVRINFSGLTASLDQIVKSLPKRRLWILLDEWSEVPLDLQPYLADMLRRGFLSVRGVTAKIAAIEHRTAFRLVNDVNGQSVGIEVGADVAMSINLDEHMVFENDAAKASEFFGQMLFRHMRAIAKAQSVDYQIESPFDLVNRMFTQRDAFGEFVRASEGVPRDAIHILSRCALNANKEKISMPTVRMAARTWYQASKHNDVASRARAITLLEWIKNEVIRKRKARGFLLDVNAKDPLIDFLFDSRVLHVIKKGISSQDGQDSGKKFNAWSLDYGCYVDLFNTSAAPSGLFEAEEDEANSRTKFVDVPHTDYRSLRRAILDLSLFNAAAQN